MTVNHVVNFYGTLCVCVSAILPQTKKHKETSKANVFLHALCCTWQSKQRLYYVEKPLVPLVTLLCVSVSISCW